ncbi:MAG: hypothetical protein H0Z24_01495 [Thermosipho sp. (in: Bacteria)]|nr:hypothetical protein [Thermosipho sp. (in: thermotogales)]
MIELSNNEKIFLNFLLNFIKSFQYSIEFDENNNLILKSTNIDVNNLKKVPINKTNLEYEIYNNNIQLSLSVTELDIIENGLLIFKNLPDNYREKVKTFFKAFSNEKIIEENSYGEVLLKEEISKIYVHGFLVSMEPNFLFSYNIKTPSKSIIQKLDKFEIPFKRTAYVNKVKNILLNCENAEVAIYLADDLKKIITGESHDEINWKDVQIHAIKLLNGLNKVLFFTENEDKKYSNLIELAKTKGYKLILISESLRKYLDSERDIFGNKINTIENFYKEYSKDFQFEFVEKNLLENEEKKNLEIIEKFLSVFNLNLDVKVSNNMIQSIENNISESCILNDSFIIKREVLKNTKATLKNFLKNMSKLLNPDQNSYESLLDISAEILLELMNIKSYKSSVKPKKTILEKLFKKFK